MTERCTYKDPSPYQIEVLDAFFVAGAFEGVATEFGDIWIAMGWEDRINSTLQMRNFDRAVDILTRAGFVRIADETYPELTAFGRSWIAKHREVRARKKTAS